MKMFGLAIFIWKELFSMEGKINFGRKFALFCSHTEIVCSFMMKCQKVEFDFKAEIGWMIFL